MRPSLLTPRKHRDIGRALVTCEWLPHRSDPHTEGGGDCRWKDRGLQVGIGELQVGLGDCRRGDRGLPV